MKFFAAVLLLAAPVWAGKRIVTPLYQDGKVLKVEMLLDAEHLRINMGNMGSIIFRSDGEGPRMLMLEPSGSSYTQVDAAALTDLSLTVNKLLDDTFAKLPPGFREQMMQQMKEQMSSAIQVVPTFHELGPRTVKGTRCTAFAILRGGTKEQETCLAQPEALKISSADAAVLEKVRSFSDDLLKAIATLPLPIPIEAFGEQLKTFPGANGFSIQTISFGTNGEAHEELLETIEDATFSEADFSVGAATRRAILPPGLGR